jgi:hypothetical protein
MSSEERKPVTVLLTVLAYIVVTFGVQGTSHFVINAGHYAAIPIMRTEPVVAMGITSMIIQGLLFAWLFPIFNRTGSSVKNGLLFSWAIGVFLSSYIVLGEAGKYAIPSIPSWVVVETSSSFVQFTVFGAILGWLHRRSVPLHVHQTA